MKLFVASWLVLLFLSGCAGTTTKRKAPDLELADIGGNLVQLSRWRGSVVLLELFGVHCGSCQAMMSQLLAFHDEFGSGGRVRMLSVDLGQRFDGLGAQRESEVREWRSHYEANWTFAFDQGHVVADLYDVIARPTLLLIDAEGRIAWDEGGWVPVATLRAETQRVLGVGP